eukprot:COSAG01_NODE_470_length_16575_cov_5.572408_4_plen_306_part_00
MIYKSRRLARGGRQARHPRSCRGSARAWRTLTLNPRPAPTCISYGGAPTHRCRQPQHGHPSTAGRRSAVHAVVASDLPIIVWCPQRPEGRAVGQPASEPGGERLVAATASVNRTIVTRNPCMPPPPPSPPPLPPVSRPQPTKTPRPTDKTSPAYPDGIGPAGGPSRVELAIVVAVCGEVEHARIIPAERHRQSEAHTLEERYSWAVNSLKIAHSKAVCVPFPWCTSLFEGFHPQFIDKNRCDIGKSQSLRTSSRMETPGTPIDDEHLAARRHGALCRPRGHRGVVEQAWHPAPTNGAGEFTSVCR